MHVTYLLLTWIHDVRTDTTFTEFWETYLLHMEDTRTEVTIQLIEWRTLLGRTSHEGLLEQLHRYAVLYGSINHAYILVAFGKGISSSEGCKSTDRPYRLVLLSRFTVSYAVYGIHTDGVV